MKVQKKKIPKVLMLKVKSEQNVNAVIKEITDIQYTHTCCHWRGIKWMQAKDMNEESSSE